MAAMTLDQLRIFLAVAEHLHFTRAAEALYITQPAVSAAIQTLEQEYAVKLFHRIGRNIEITEAGKFLQVEVQKILDLVTLTERGLRELNDLQRGQLNLGSSLTIGNYWLPEKISRFQRLYPGISINCTLANAETICVATATGQFDLGLVEGEVQPSLKNCLDEEVVGSDRLLIVVGKFHPWYDEQKVNLTELTKAEWVMRESGSGTQQRFEQALLSWGINPSELNVISLLNSGEMVKAVVENGVGATALSELMVIKELQLDSLRAVTVIDNRGSKPVLLEIARPFLKLKHKQRFQSKLAIAFEKMLIGD
jgi:DNA-binding transcriptional LysR family regulator